MDVDATGATGGQSGPGVLATARWAMTARNTRAGRWKMRDAVLGSNGPRRYLAPDMTLTDFFHELTARGVPHAALRWFEDLPEVEEGEDVDLLVGDEHLDVVFGLLRKRPARPDSQTFDIYTASGLPGSDFGGGVPYYPPEFARSMLASAVLMRDLVRVPDPEHHFLSLAYHAVYHKGYASGLPADEGADADADVSDHDYAGVLTDLATRLGRPMVPTLATLDEVLAEAGLRPPLDTLERLKPNNPWIHDRFFADLPVLDPAWQGLTVFVVRERAHGMLKLVTEEINRHGFEVLEVLELDQAQREAARRRIRGGNWERGPWLVSGGGPSAYVIAYDVAPWSGPGGPWGDNLRVPEAKAKIRDRLLRDVPGPEQYNPLHSSDNARQALDYLDVLEDLELLERVRKQSAELRDRCRMPFPILRHLAYDGPARRARVALVQHPVHGPCVCKVYRPGAMRYFEREVTARSELGDIPAVPELLERGDNWLLTPHYRDDGRHVLRHMPLEDRLDNAVQLRPEAARAMAALARDLHQRGYFLLDLTTENLHSDPRAGLKVLDMEFLQAYQGPVPPLEKSYTFRGVPKDLRHRYDAPQDVPLTDRVGNQVFHPAVAGLPIGALLRPPRPGDDLRRAVTQLSWSVRLGAGRVPARTARLLNRSRWGRLAKRIVRKLVRSIR